MLKVVENEVAIRRYQRQFVRALRPLTDATIPVKLGHPGASEKAKVAWLERLGIWFFSRKIAGDRYWHAFGVGRPENPEIPVADHVLSNFTAEEIARIRELAPAVADLLRQSYPATKIEVRETVGNLLRVAFAGDDAEIAGLLQKVVGAGHAVRAFREVPLDLEKIYLKVTAEAAAGQRRVN